MLILAARVGMRSEAICLSNSVRDISKTPSGVLCFWYNEAVRKGFTLIELLVVIAILAALAAGVILVLNPAELLKQSRDSTRLSDLAALNNAISVWVTDFGPAATNWTATTTCASTVATQFPLLSGNDTCTQKIGTNVDGTGWVNIDLNQISGGAPLARLPIDPLGTESAAYWYGYRSTSTVGKYKLIAKMESEKNVQGGTIDVESTDGGVLPGYYELGSELNP